MIELLRRPVVVPGRVPSMVNIGMNWRVARIPTEKIKNPVTLKKKQSYDYAMEWRDLAVFLLRAEGRAQAPAGTALFVHIVFAFKPAKGRDNPADLAQDIDNGQKCLLDAIQKSGIAFNDKQIITLFIEKVCAAGETQATVRSIAAGRPRDKRRWLQGLVLEGETPCLRP